MTSITLGSKHSCALCNTKFYDLNKVPPACPKCGEKVPVAKPVVKRKRRIDDDSTTSAKVSASHITVVTAMPMRKFTKRG